MKVEYVMEYHDIMRDQESLRQHASFISSIHSMADLKRRLLDKADVCAAQCSMADSYIQRLPEPKRSIAYLSFCKGLKPADVADKLNMDSRKIQRLKLAAIDQLARM